MSQEHTPPTTATKSAAAILSLFTAAETLYHFLAATVLVVTYSFIYDSLGFTQTISLFKLTNLKFFCIATLISYTLSFLLPCLLIYIYWLGGQKRKLRAVIWGLIILGTSATGLLTKLGNQQLCIVRIAGADPGETAMTELKNRLPFPVAIISSCRPLTIVYRAENKAADRQKQAEIHRLLREVKIIPSNESICNLPAAGL